ncbi:phosphopantetheine-binding protein [Acetivibrio mesophilus]|uniref:Acyl carrier protein n=1 Tax=Acetivibrio mesophilus TaxID=2487273 RepID=A0A4Q0I8G6_9FIRM|nr:phosphopantetheine-binding protein [Acetivibrio mesophilus]RXE60688.1 acyl carrier protein [Acetivibrio mesophilus]HHV28101.1 acyl carrier protein [Clostridium sp.]
MPILSSEQVSEKVVKVLRNHLDSSSECTEISTESTLDELGLDSFKAIHVLLDLEEEFQIQIPDSMLSPEIFASVGALKHAVESILESQ